MSPDVSLPQFDVLGHRQRIVEASLSSGNYSRWTWFWSTMMILMKKRQKTKDKRQNTKDKRQKTKNTKDKIQKTTASAPETILGQPSYSHLLTPRFRSPMMIVMMILVTLTMNNNWDQDHFWGNNLNIPTTLLTDYFENDNGVKLKERISWQWTFGQWWWHRLERRLLRDP